VSDLQLSSALEKRILRTQLSEEQRMNSQQVALNQRLEGSF